MAWTSLLLAATTLAAALALVWAAVGLFSGRLPWVGRGGRGAAAVAFVGALGALTALLWAGWGGPFGGDAVRTKPLPDTRRADLGDHSLVTRVERALPPSNRGARPRVRPAPGPPPPGVAVLWIAADDAPDAVAARRRILDDAWRAADATFRDPALGRVRTVRLAFTHPSGRSSRPGAEPVVALVEVDREVHRRLRGRQDAARRLETAARVRWFPPLDRP